MKKIGFILVGLVVIIVLVLLFEQEAGDSSVREEREDVQESLTQASCETSGGSWNSCGSACRTTPESPCIEVCVEYCECVSDAQCPTGLTCQDFVDEVGVCL